MSIRPQERWNRRSENGPCTRVTWLWYNSIGFLQPAAILIVLGIRSEDARQQDVGGRHPRSSRKRWQGDREVRRDVNVRSDDGRSWGLKGRRHPRIVPQIAKPWVTAARRLRNRLVIFPRQAGFLPGLPPSGMAQATHRFTLPERDCLGPGPGSRRRNGRSTGRASPSSRHVRRTGARRFPWTPATGYRRHRRPGKDRWCRSGPRR